MFEVGIQLPACVLLSYVSLANNHVLDHEQEGLAETHEVTVQITNMHACLHDCCWASAFCPETTCWTMGRRGWQEHTRWRASCWGRSVEHDAQGGSVAAMCTVIFCPEESSMQCNRLSLSADCVALCSFSTMQVLDALEVAHSGSGTLPEAAAPAFVSKGSYKARDRLRCTQSRGA
jgi:hypothetical protein